MKPRSDGYGPCFARLAFVCAVLFVLGDPTASGRTLPREEGAICGNGVIDVGETCDGGPPLNLDGENCNTLGFPGGTLRCASDCADFDTTQCLANPTCGNDVLEPGEVCDGSQLGLQTCQSQGYSDAAALTCLPDCSGCNTDACVPAAIPPNDCGFDAISMPDESTLRWASVADIDMVKGPLRRVRAYKVSELRRDFGVTEIDIAADNPVSGEGFYYLLKHLTTCPDPGTGPVGKPSWFATGQRYDRDDLLPDGGCNRRVPDVWTVNGSSQTYTALNGCTDQARLGGSLTAVGNGAGPRSIAFSTVTGTQGDFALISQGEFLQVIDAQTGTIADQINVAHLIGRPGICSASGTTCSGPAECGAAGGEVCETAVDLRGIGTSIPQVFEDPSPVERAFIYIAANVRVTPTDRRPWFIVLDQASALDGAGGLVSHVQDAELQIPAAGGNAEAVDVTVISAPNAADSTEFQRAWFSARGNGTDELFARLVATPVGVIPADWTVRRSVVATIQTGLPPRQVQIGAGDQGELVLLPEGDQGTLLDLERAAPATVCSLSGTQIAVDIEGPAGGSYTAYSVDQTGDQVTIVHERDIDGLTCAGALTVPVGAQPTAVDVMGESFQVKAFVSNGAGHTVTSFDKHGGDITTTALFPIDMMPVDVAVRQTPSRSCNVKDIQVVDGEVDFSPVGCDADEIFMVWCRCTDASGLTCPPECPYNPSESCPQCEEVGDNPWEEIGAGEGGSKTKVPKGNSTEITVKSEKREPLP
jgi:hypothetical protein